MDDQCGQQPGNGLHGFVQRLGSRQAFVFVLRGEQKFEIDLADVLPHLRHTHEQGQRSAAPKACQRQLEMPMRNGPFTEKQHSHSSGEFSCVAWCSSAMR